MGKASDVFKSRSSGPHTGRFLFLFILLILVVGAMLAARKGLFTSARAPEPAAPGGAAPSGTGNALGARVKADNDAVGVEMRGTVTVTPPVDNVTTPATPPPDNDVFAAVRDGTTVTVAERAAYYRVAREAWELGQTAETQTPPPLVTRVDLVAHPAEYRDRLVRVRGSLVRVRPQTFDPDPEQPGRPTLYYECALKLVNEDISIVLVYENPLDAGINPYRGVVDADGYFFKVWGYNDDTLQAPLLMGYRLVKEPGLAAPSVTGMLILTAGVLVVAAIWFLRNRRRREAQEIADRLRRVPPDEVYIPEPKSLPRDKRYEEQPPKTGDEKDGNG